MPNKSLFLTACLALLSGCANPNLGSTRVAPASGIELLQRMHDAYDGKWFMALPNDFFVAEKWGDTPHWFHGK